jgi:biopolymer transport protein ExbB/TolQ
MNEPKTFGNLISAFQLAMSKTLELVQSHGPGFLSRAIDAYRSGKRALETTALSASGLDLRSALIAICITITLFFMANTYYSRSVRAAYQNYKPDSLCKVDSIGEARRQLRTLGWVAEDSESAGQAIQKIRNEDFSLPLYRWMEVEFLSSGTDTENNELRRELKRHVTGNQQGWILVSSQVTTGSDVFARLSESRPAAISIIDDNQIRKHTFLSMLNDLTSAVQQRLRVQTRFNGSIQFVTVFVSIFTLTALIRRYLLVLKLAGRWLGKSLETTMEDPTGDPQTIELKQVVGRLVETSDADAEARIREELGRLSEETTDEVYDGYWFLAGMLPSLGFIGTVIGMSSSLMLADRLFLDVDRQLAIGRMTNELGLAFDTTLVALVLGIVTSVPLVAMRNRERTFFREFAASVEEYRKHQMDSQSA